MRKKLVAITAAMLSLSLCACSGGQNEPTRAEDELSAALRSLAAEIAGEDTRKIYWNESEEPVNLTADYLAIAADTVIADVPELKAVQDSTFSVKWEDGAVLSLKALEPIGKIRLQYDQEGSTLIAMAESPELYTWMIAADECPAAEMADVDGDGFMESLFWAPQLCIYDYYGNQVHGNEYEDETCGNGGGPVAFIYQLSIGKYLDAEKQNLLVITRQGERKVFSYLDGELTYVCTDEELEHQASVE